MSRRPQRFGRFAEADAILARCLELPESERRPFLEHACHAEVELRASIERLLRLAETEDPLLTEGGALAGSIGRALAAGDAAPAEPDPGLVGRTLARYEIVKLLGRGGMGEVYEALDTRLRRRVAVKVLPRALAADAERRARFEREARSVAALRHPNIVTLHAIEEADGELFLVMELVDGVPLDRKIPATGMQLEPFLELAIPLAEAVAAAHARGITHRDLKPGNVLIDAENAVRVLDFGLAKPGTDPGQPGSTLGPGRGQDLTVEGRILGTPAYMSPEQAEGKPVDTRSDIFSLGVMLYEMATGRRPFQGESAISLIASILRDEPKAVSELRPDLPRRLEEIVHGCLHKEPSRRYQSALDLRNGLVELRQEWSSGRVRVAADRAGVPALAVLPLVDRSPGGSDAYFSEGVTEALITELAKVAGVRIIAGASSLRYRETTKSHNEIGAELGVDHLVEGSVLRLADRVRISARLMSARTGELIWAERYDRAFEDVLLLQAEVAEAIARQVGTVLAGPEAPGLEGAAPARRKVGPDVYLLGLQAQHQWSRRTEEGFRAGLRLFREAVDRDATYAPAWVGIADCYGMLANYGHQPAREIHPAARAAATRALVLDDASADAHRVLAFIHWQFEFDWRAAIDEYERALALDPHSALATYWYGTCLAVIGDHARALELLARAAELDPLSLLIPAVRGWVHYFARRYEEALPRYQRVLSLDPDFFPAVWFRGEALCELGRYDEAIADLERALDLSGGIARLRGYLGYAYARAGRTDEARRTLAELERHAADRYVPPYFPALVHAGLEEADAALTLLERSLEIGDTMIRDLRADSQWDRMRGLPRFQALMERLAFPYPAR